MTSPTGSTDPSPYDPSARVVVHANTPSGIPATGSADPSGMSVIDSPELSVR